MSDSKALTTTEQPRQLAQFGELSVEGIVKRKEKILEVMRSVMRDGQHYGTIPGCGDKPTLYKSGAEILATTFALAPEFKIARTELPGGHREYEIVCTMVHIPSGLKLGEGVGTCSTMESKYRWRKGSRTCPECGKGGFLLKSKQKPEWFCWSKPSAGKDGCGATFALDDNRITDQNTDRVENPDIADQYNTVLKMAKKRAQVDATLTATGASDLLTQDLEDIRGVADDFRGEVEDADFREVPPQEDFDQRTDRPAPSTNGHRSNGSARNGGGNGRAGRNDLDAAASELLAEISQARSPDEVRKLGPRCSTLPKGSPQRAQVSAAYNKRIADTSAPAVA